MLVFEVATEHQRFQLVAVAGMRHNVVAEQPLHVVVWRRSYPQTLLQLQFVRVQSRTIHRLVFGIDQLLSEHLLILNQLAHFFDFLEFLISLLHLMESQVL